jgi:uncharacterized protein
MKDALHKTIAIVKTRMQSDGGAHDWSHVERVARLAHKMGKRERADQMVIQLCALFHDISDTKLNGGDAKMAPAITSDVLRSTGFSDEVVSNVTNFVGSMGFKRVGNEDRDNWPIEWKVVQDADFLDAMGAVGIARAFWFSGFLGEPICASAEMPRIDLLEDGVVSEKSSIGHFSHKLLRLKNLMLTDSGKALALEKHSSMVKFLESFRSEWNE